MNAGGGVRCELRRGVWGPSATVWPGLGEEDRDSRWHLSRLRPVTNLSEHSTTHHYNVFVRNKDQSFLSDPSKHKGIPKVIICTAFKSLWMDKIQFKKELKTNRILNFYLWDRCVNFSPGSELPAKAICCHIHSLVIWTSRGFSSLKGELRFPLCYSFFHWVLALPHIIRWSPHRSMFTSVRGWWWNNTETWHYTGLCPAWSQTYHMVSLSLYLIARGIAWHSTHMSSVLRTVSQSQFKQDLQIC